MSIAPWYARYIVGAPPVMIRTHGTEIDIDQSYSGDCGTTDKRTRHYRLKTDRVCSGVDASLNAETVVAWAGHEVGIIRPRRLSEGLVQVAFQDLCSQLIVVKDAVEEDIYELRESISRCERSLGETRREIQDLYGQLEDKAGSRGQLSRPGGGPPAEAFGEWKTAEKRRRPKSRLAQDTGLKAGKGLGVGELERVLSSLGSGESFQHESRAGEKAVHRVSKTKEQLRYCELRRNSLVLQLHELRDELQDLEVRNPGLSCCHAAPESAGEQESEGTSEPAQSSSVLSARISLGAGIIAVMMSRCIRIFERTTGQKDTSFELAHTIYCSIDIDERREPPLDVSDKHRAVAWSNLSGDVGIVRFAEGLKCRYHMKDESNGLTRVQALKFSPDASHLIIGLERGIYSMVLLDCAHPVETRRLRIHEPNLRSDFMVHPSGNLTIPIGTPSDITGIVHWTSAGTNLYPSPERMSSFSGGYGIQAIHGSDSCVLRGSIVSDGGTEVAAIVSRGSLPDSALFQEEADAIRHEIESIARHSSSPPTEAESFLIVMLGVVLDHTKFLRLMLKNAQKEGGGLTD